MSSSLNEPVLLGIVGAAHGIRGEVRVKSYTAVPEAIGTYGVLRDNKGRSFTVLSARPQKTVVVVRFAEVKDRNAAEALNGTELFVERALMPAEDDDGFLYDDLIGLEARDDAGTVYGRVVAAHDFGAGDILELKPPAGPTVMIPFTEVAVPQIDVAAGTITIEPVAAGLKDAIEVREGDEEGEPE